MLFKVVMKQQGKMDTNPFHTGPIFGTVEIETRTWEMEADSEEQIRAFYADAVEKDLRNVRGFDLISITPIECIPTGEEPK